MGDVGIAEMLVIGTIALLVFGPDRLPELARGAGKLVTKLRAQASSAMDELRRAADLGEVEQEFKTLSADMRKMQEMARNPLRAAADAASGSNGAAAGTSAGDTPAGDVPPVDFEAT